MALKLSQGLAQLMVAETGNTGQAHALFSQALNWELPDLATTLALVRIVWAASSDNLSALNASPETLHALANPTSNNKQTVELHNDDILLCKEALELLSTSVVLNSSSLEHLYQDNWWPYFITDLVLLNPNSAVRIAAAEQLIIICTCGAASRLALQLIPQLLFSLLDTLVIEYANTSHEFFQLLCRLVNVAYITGCLLPDTEQLLANEVAWLRKARDKNDVLIEGHLSLAKELLSFSTTEQRCQLGSGEGSLIKELLEDFLCPASKLMLQLNKTGQLGEDPAIPICDTPQTQAAAFDLLITLCLNCVENFKQLVSMLTEMFYSDPETTITEWDYLPAVGPRPFQGFVGLKNAGATCYMNSVLQQLYMVESIKEGILAAEGAATDPNEDFTGEERMDLESDCHDERNCLDDNRKDYNVGILKQVQAIFGHLACSRLQYYVPRGLWRHFKLQGKRRVLWWY